MSEAIAPSRLLQFGAGRAREATRVHLRHASLTGRRGRDEDVPWQHFAVAPQRITSGEQFGMFGRFVPFGSTDRDLNMP